jgi:hypothetical protein
MGNVLFVLHSRTGEITRAVIHLYPLEIHSNLYDSSESEESPATLTQPKRLERQTKTLAKQRIRAILNQD